MGLLEERDEDDDKLEMKGNFEESQTSELAATSSCATEAEADEDLETILLIEEIDSNDGKDKVVSSTDVLEKDVDVQEHNFKIPQLDGKAESSEDDDDLSDDNDDDLDSGSDLNSDEEDALDGVVGIEMDAPCSADDISDEEASELFDTE